MTKNITLVTGLWNIKRSELDGWAKRNFEDYLKKFEELLKTEVNMIIYGDDELSEFVQKRRSSDNTQFIKRDLSWFETSDYFNAIQKIRLNSDWVNQVGWLKESPQAQLEYYNPIVMSKMFLLHDAKILSKFESEYFFWIDAALTNTVHQGYFTHDKVLDKLTEFVTDFCFVCFPYDSDTEVHGFEYKKLCDITRTKTNKVARGGFFGGTKSSIEKANGIYYDLLHNTLNGGYMGTEETLFTIMVYKYPELFEYSEIECDGLLWKFFENLKDEKIFLKREKIFNIENNKNKLYTDKSGLYVLSFNSPKQFETLIESMLSYDKNFIEKTTKFLLDNSTDENTFEKYKNLCDKFNFEHIKKDNLGICGGRQYIAEHFDSTDLEYMYFFEDDMFLYPHKGELCKNGFNRYTENLYLKMMKIMSKEGFDFIKLCFTEFYGDNSTQWSWYNVPQNKREEYWPDYYKLPEHGIDSNSPKTIFKEIKSIESLAYASGEIYYCNWPQLVSKEGNKKMFLNTKWGHPFEQTWMSHIYQLTRENKINPSVLLLSPIEHNRFEHYSGKIRKES
jgi:hypothetical protein